MDILELRAPRRGRDGRIQCRIEQGSESGRWHVINADGRRFIAAASTRAAARMGVENHLAFERRLGEVIRFG